jgi:hypothetical protein
MSIKLDWEVESEGGWEEVGEDPKEVEARRRRTRRIRNSVLTVLVILLMAGGVIAYRLITVGWQIRSALEETVAAETLALRLGDRNAFLAVQSNVGGWQERQERTFDQYRSEDKQVEVTGQVVKMDISADQARVILREIYNNTEYNVMWFYQRDEEGWKHIAPVAGYWGEPREDKSAHFDFDYYSEDQMTVDALRTQLNSWWGTACERTDCVGKPDLIHIKIEPDELATVSWADYDPNTLLIPSPLTGRFRADGTVDPEIRKQIANYIAERWADHMIGQGASKYSNAKWFENEIYLWLYQIFEPDQPSAPLLTPLVQTYGDQIVPQLVLRIKRGENATAVLIDLTHTALPDLPVKWDLYLTYQLRAEAELDAKGQQTEAILIYHDPARPGGTLGVCADKDISIDSIRVTGLRRYGDIFWAETHCGPPESPTTTVFLPFRLLSDRWVLTRASEDDLGPAREEQGTHVILRYFDIDASLVDGLLADIEQAYSQIVADFGIADGGPGMVLTVVSVDASTERPAMTGAWQAQDPPDSITLYLTSSRVFTNTSYQYRFSGYPITNEGIHDSAISFLVFDLLERETGESGAGLLTSAIQFWEISRLLDRDDLASTIASEGDKILRQPPESMESLWSTDYRSIEETLHDVMSARVLIDLLVEQYGDGAVSWLISNMSQASSLDDLLYRSLGIHNTTVEAEWHERVQKTLDALPQANE